mgnify:CR=1 FL=1
MKTSNSITPRLICASLLASVLCACAPSSYNISAPSPSAITYEKTSNKAKTINVVDARVDTDKTFHSGILQSTLQFDGVAIDPIPFLLSHAQAELRSRGLPITLTQNSTGSVAVRSFKMQNHRSNGYSPYVSLTSFSADLKTKQGVKRIAGFIKRGKVPVWSFDEVIEPTMNEPLALAVQEFASKLNNALYGHKASNSDVDNLAKLAKSNTDGKAYLKVYELGFTNNKRAVNTIVELLDSKDEYKRLAAISSLGTLRATDQVSRLKEIATNGKIWQDRAMALKSLGDINTKETTNFLTAERERFSNKKGKEALWSTGIINLYLP